MSFGINVLKEKLLQLWKRGAFHILIGSFLTKFVVFFGSIFIVRILSKDDYGLLGYIENIYGYIYLFAGMGLGNALLRYVILGKTEEDKYGYYRYAMVKGTIFNVLLVLLAAVALVLYPHPVEFVDAKWLLLLTLLVLPFQFLTDSNSLTYRAMFDNKRFAIIAFLVSSILVVGQYVGALSFELSGVVIAKVIVYVILGISLSFISYRLYFKGANPYQLTKANEKEVNRYSQQYMVTNGIWMLFMLNDIFLLAQLTGDSEIVADYKVAYVLPGILTIISTAIGVFVGPYFVKHESDKAWVWKNYIKTLTIVVALISPVVILLFVFAKEIIILLYGIQYENIITIMRLLLIAIFINTTLRYTTANLLAAMGQIKYNMIISVVGIILQVGINLIFIPIYGAVGAALTSIIVYSIMAIALFIIFIKRYKLSM